MASLKDMRVRIAATKATQKITKAMQMVAASKLRRAQAAAEAARPYAERMSRVLGSIAAAVAGSDSAPRLLAGTDNDKVHLLVVCTAERGLCGPFNSSIVRLARERHNALTARARTSRFSASAAKAPISCAGNMASKSSKRSSCAASRTIGFEQAEMISKKIVALFDAGEFDVCTLVLLALQVGDRANPDRAADRSAGIRGGKRGRSAAASYEYEPEEGEILAICCRAICRCRCSARFWKTLPPNRARA